MNYFTLGLVALELVTLELVTLELVTLELVALGLVTLEVASDAECMYRCRMLVFCIIVTLYNCSFV